MAGSGWYGVRFPPPPPKIKFDSQRKALTANRLRLFRFIGENRGFSERRIRREKWRDTCICERRGAWGEACTPAGAACVRLDIHAVLQPALYVFILVVFHLAHQEEVEKRPDAGDGPELADLIPARRDRCPEDICSELEFEGQDEVAREVVADIQESVQLRRLAITDEADK